jgi:glycosyltransferase involved in cell wall biosynthesis
LAERIERAVLPDAAFLTASSSAIAAAYADKYGVHPIPVHNTFPLPSRAPSLEPGEGPSLRLYWFSQTIGTGRGLEDAVRAMGLANIPGELHLRGRAISEYADGLRRLAAKSAPRLKVCCHEPAPPDTMVDCCRGFDAGLAVEPGFSLNNRLALSNKAFTYMLAGLAVVMTDTSGQLPLARDLGEGAIVYSPGDIEALAAGLTRWAGDKMLLARAKATAWEAARRRWHWEHPEDCGALLAAVLMDPFIPVPPEHYGGIERVIADLANGMHRRGHAVTLWVAPGSQTSGVCEPFGRPGEWTRWSNVRNTAVVTARFWCPPGRFDLVHNFGRLAYLAGILRWDLPKVQTYMRRVNPRNMRLAKALGARRLRYTAVSVAIRDTGLPGGGDWSVIYNCASVEQYKARFDVDPVTAPLLFLGRLDRCKGAHTAIAVARRLNRPLQIAGTVSRLAHECEYFHREIEPWIDGKLVSYLGPVDNTRKNELLGNSAALLLPVEWEEPFPVVLPEAMLCGTPVIAFRRGGVPEGIDHGRTGFLCDTPEEMAAFVGRLGEIDRAHCRAEAQRRFSDTAIVDAYERLYMEMIAL